MLVVPSGGLANQNRAGSATLQKLFALGPLLAGCAAMLGWATGTPLLTQMSPGFTAMVASTAFGFIAIGAGLLLLPATGEEPAIPAWHSALAAASGAIALAIGVLTLAEYASGLSFGIDELLFTDWDRAAPHPGRPAVATAASLAAGGVAVLLLARAARRLERSGWHSVVAAHLLALVPASVSYFSLAGYAYGVKDLYSFGPFNTVSLNTGMACGLSAIALVYTLPDNGWRRWFAGRPAAFKSFKRLLVLALSLPLVIGAAVVWGSHIGAYDPGLNTALFALVVAASSSALTWQMATSVRRIEELSERTSARLAAIVTSSIDAIMSKTLDGTVTSWNESAARLFGYRAGEMIGQSVRRLIPAGRLDEEDFILGRIAAGEDIEHYETVRLHKDGHPIDVSVTVSPIRDAAGAITGVSKIVRDISALKQAEAAAREREKRNRYFLELDKRLREARTAREAVNAACEEIGLELDAVFAGVGELQPGSEHTIVESAWTRTGATPPIHGRYQYIGAKRIAELLSNGPVAVTDVTADLRLAADEGAQAVYKTFGARASLNVPLTRGGSLRAYLFIGCAEPRVWTAAETALAQETLDRTWQAAERARAEEALRQSEEQLRRLGDSLPDSAIYRYAHSADGRPRFEYVSAGIEKLNGVRVEDVLRDAGALHRQIPPDYLPALVEAERESARAMSDFKMVVPMRRPDGEVRWMRLHSRPHRVPDGGVTWDGVQTDITALKETETALRESEERLALALRAGEFGVFDRDLRTGRTEWDAAMHRLWGIPEGKAVTYESFEARLHPDDRGKVEAAMARALDPAGSHHYHCEYRIVSTADRAVRWIFADGDVTFESETPVRHIGVVKDITARKLMEESLRQSEERFRGIFEHAGTGIAITNFEGQFQSCNPAFSAMVGYTEEELRGLNFPELVHPADREANVVAGAQLRAQEIALFEVFNRYVHKDGKTVWVHKTVSILRDAAGRPTHHIALVTDITERRQAEEQIRRSEALLKSATNNAGVGLVLLSHNRRYLFANRAYSVILGLGSGDIVGKGPAEVLPDLYKDQISPRLDRAFAGERVTYELVKADALGERRYYTVVYDPLRDDRGHVTNVIVVIYDITAPKLAELRVAASEERFRGIYEHAATGIAITDLQGRFQSCNPAHSAMLGYMEDELRTLNFLELVHPEDRDANMVEIRRLLAQEIPSFEIVNRYIAKGGRTIWVHKHLSLLRDTAGQPTNIVALVTDMTERKRHEEQIRLLMREVNHRSKNMLALVQAVARQTVAATPDDFIGRFGERIRALAAAQDLLVKSEWKGVDIEELILSQLAHFKDLTGARIELKGQPISINASAAQTIGMALHELATNAGKYGALVNDDGRVAIEWRLEPGQAGPDAFKLSWSESGGPRVAAPDRKGFGSTVICQLAEMNLEAIVDLDFAETGLIWRLQCPAREVLDDRHPAG